MRAGAKILSPNITYYSSISSQSPEEKCISFLKSITHIRQFNQILSFFFTNGLSNSSFLPTKLIDFCNSFNHMDLASSIFRQIPQQSSFLWTSMIRGFAQNGPHYQSILYYAKMHGNGTEPNHLTHPFVLKACSNLKALLEGEQIHTRVVKSGFLTDTYVFNGVLELYSKCGCVDDARNVYDEMPQRDFISHTSMISGYFGVGDLVSAQSVFERVEVADVILWSAMIAGYAQNGAPSEALELFHQMQNAGAKPNQVTFVSVVSACSQLGDLETGRWVHDLMVRNGMEMNIFVSTALLDMYIKGGFIDEAREIFDRIRNRDVASWNSLINGYAKNGYAKEALEVFKEMQEMGLKPNRVTFLSVLTSCAQLGALEKGKEIDHLINEMGVGSDLSIETALLDMYTKCGSLLNAYRIFSRIYLRDVVAWSAIISGFATNGHFEEAISLFGGMLKDGVWPNEVTFVGILMACSHGGLIHEGYKFFYSMDRDYGISPKMEHYSCMVDLLGRAGLVKEAKTFIDGMPIEPGVSIWGSLLGACTTHKNTDIGEFAIRRLVELDPANDGNHVLLSNIYAATKRWEDVESTRAMMKHNGAHKTPGCSWIEVKGKIHEFFVADKTNSQFLQLYEVLNNLSDQLRLVGEFQFG
ncbi:Pentatricopeptide repeat [Macleaya cordata]|uniref:Pentatricopeptide repeat n=1 Tax=Macleaya cordata TaxID=56857 RepID=A0A200QJW7_MACCD|nr:Pentatricopeptide repeat [Macleaya cordata]